MNPDFQDRFKNIIVKTKEAGMDYAEKKAKSWNLQKLESTLLSKLIKDEVARGAKISHAEITAKASHEYITHIEGTAIAIEEELKAKCLYENCQMSFEGLRSLSSLEKRTQEIIGS